MTREEDAITRPNLRFDDEERRLESIVADVWHHGETLVRAELALAVSRGRAEVEGHVEDAKRALKRAAIVEGFLNAGYLAILASVVMGLGTFMPLWAAALLVGVASFGIGYGMTRVPAKASDARAAIAPWASGSATVRAPARSQPISTSNTQRGTSP
jgi:fatty acid desaturase